MQKLLVLLALGSSLACTDGSRGGSTGASTGGIPPVGTCSKAFTGQVFASCSDTEPCGCPLGCIDDPAFGSMVCEAPCADPCPGTFALPGTSQSLPTASACVEGWCRLDACGFDPSGAAAAGSYGGPCSVVSAGDGTCFPTGRTLPDGGLVGWGICLLGNPEGECGSEPDPACPAGHFCIAGGCRPPCDPTVDAGCADGASCQQFPGAVNPHAGYCGPPCGSNGKACGEVCCDPSSSCNGTICSR
jgi:hypothetical protein